ncbi:hypothetical protein ACHAW5_000818 [Stephanodiscus triporus]|uniref:Uncharacterized protein n=1 Tax=Stephanodiscus triporus TaxID=2934178 RepID=A0ABD3N2A0_9STRA
MTATEQNKYRKKNSFVVIAFALSLGISPTRGFQAALPPSPATDEIKAGLIKCAGNRHHYTSARRHHKTPSELSLENKDDESRETIDPVTKAEIRKIANHIATQTLESLLSPSEARAITNELLFDNESKSSVFNDASYQQYVKYSKKVEARLREEDQRTPAELLGRDLTDRILSSIRGDAPSSKNGRGRSINYDPQTVRTFLESDAINSLFTQLLYDAIFEFTTKFDILGNAISNLPLLGPVRNQVLKESKRNMDRTLGPLLQMFLSGYTRVAIRQAVDFVVSEENAPAFGKANARLVSYLLEKRTVADWLPEESVLAEWREEIWSYLVGLEDGAENGVKDDQKKIVEQSIEWLYDLVGDKCIEDVGLNVDNILNASPTFEKSLGKFWQRCQDASES